jgi:hypothetical protein
MAANSGLLLGALYTLLTSHAIAQTTTALPPAQTYANGQFYSPDTAKTQVFTSGSTMTISWDTVFKSVDIYLVSGQTTVMGKLQSKELFGRIADLSFQVVLPSPRFDGSSTTMAIIAFLSRYLL